MNDTQTKVVPCVMFERKEEADQGGTLRTHVYFYDGDGGVLESWRVPLYDYLAAYDGLDAPVLREMAHRVMVARALLHGLPVPDSVVDSHNAQYLDERVVVERRLHGWDVEKDELIPNPKCGLCFPPVEAEA